MLVAAVLVAASKTSLFCPGSSFQGTGDPKKIIPTQWTLITPCLDERLCTANLRFNVRLEA